MKSHLSKTVIATNNYLLRIYIPTITLNKDATMNKLSSNFRDIF